MTDDIIRRLERKLFFYRILILLIVLGHACWWGYSLFFGRCYILAVDEKEIACVKSKAEAQQAIQLAKTLIPGVKAGEVQFVHDIKIKRAKHECVPISKNEAARAIIASVPVKVQKYAILIDEKPAVALDSEESAAYVLAQVKMNYGKMAKNLLEEPSFKEKVSIRKTAVDPKIYKNEEEAIKFLLAGGSASEYTVQAGDIASKIAERYHMTLEELSRLNPGRNLDRLNIGDKLNVSDKPSSEESPKLTVIVRNKREQTELIPFRTIFVPDTRFFEGKQFEISPGRSGLRRTAVIETWENGRLVGKEVVEQTTLRKSISRRVAVGTLKR